MPYLRLLTNALVAGALGATMLVHVLLLLNPQVPLRPAVLFSLGWRVAVTAGAMLTAGFFFASVARYLSTRRGPGWLSLRLLAWMTTLVVSLGTLLAWLNLSAFGPSLSPAAARRFAIATVALAVTALVLLVIALVHYGFGRRGSRVGGTLLGIAVVAAVVLPLVARGPGDPRPAVGSTTTRVVDASVREPPAGRVWLVLLDGASLDYVSPAAAQGRLPNLGRLLDGGASLTLFSIEPRQPAPIWTAVATGRYPHANAITSEGRHRGGWAELHLLPRYVFADVLVLSGLLTHVRVEPADLRGAPLWQVLDASAVPVLVVDWPLASGSTLQAGRVLRTTTEHVDPIDADRTRHRAFEEALAAVPYQVAAIRYSALSALGAERLTRPSAVPGRRSIDEAYDAIDRHVGRTLERLLPDDLLLVISGYRLEPASPVERVRARLVDDAGLVAEADRSDGFLLAYGRHVSPGRKTVGAIVDVLPTVLYYLGLPVARDMHGFARTDLFTATLTTERPVSFIRSYQ